MRKLSVFFVIYLLAASLAGAQEARDLIVDGVNLGRQEKFDEAVASFEKALELDPASLAGHINIATAYLFWGDKEDKSKYIEAVKALERANMLAPHDRQASRWMTQNGRNIIAYLEEKVSTDPEDPKAHYDLASAYMLLGKTEEAIGEYEKSVSLAPDSAPIQCDLGRALLREGRTEETSRALERAVELDPKLSGALLNLANLRYREGDLDSALALYRNALEVDTDNAIAHAQLGNLYLKLGKLEEAKTELSAALKLNRHLIHTYLDLADVYLRKKKIRAAIEQCEAALKEKSRFPEAEILLGQLYYLEKDIPNARKHFRKYLQTSGQHAVENEELAGKFREHCKEKIQEIRALDRKGKPRKSSERLFKTAHRYYEAGDYDSAVDVINKILDKEEAMGKVYTLLANILIKKEDPEPGLAMSIFRDALRDHIYLDKGSRILALHGLAKACSMAERPDEAEEALNELLSLQPDCVEAYYDLGLLYAGQGDKEKSLENLRKGAALENEKGIKTSLDLVMEEPAFNFMREGEEFGKLRKEYIR